MALRVIIIKIPMMLAIVLMLALVFTFSNADTVSAPYWSDGDANQAGFRSPVVAADAIVSDVFPESTDPPLGNMDDHEAKAELPEKTPEIPEISDYITVHMDDYSVFQGSLVLINHDHSYEIPNKNDFVNLAREKTESYKVFGEDMLLSAKVIAPLNNMMDAFCAETGRDNITVRSAFRDYAKQQEIVNEYIALVGMNEATRWAALPGHSEHHAGLAVDLGVYADGEVGVFINTGVNSWFVQNSWKYGFILRFPTDKSDITKTAYEPWHYRYVGVPHAYIMHLNDQCFEEYIESIAEFTWAEPLNVEYEDDLYSIYFTRSVDIDIPFDCEFEISGNNIDGFIVTIKYSPQAGADFGEGGFDDALGVGGVD